MKLNRAISGRLTELLKEADDAQCQLSSGSVPKSTISSILRCSMIQ